MLHGRTRERAEIAALVAEARAGRSFALLIEGPAGIGKSTLLEDAVAGAHTMQVLRARGFEAESDMPYGGLLQLVGPLLALADGLPAPQRTALHGALALEATTPRDRFAVPVAFLALLSVAAERAPVLVVVDDVHWLDAASYEAVLFAARRVSWEGVGVLLAARDSDGGPVEAEEIPRLRLRGLDHDSALAVVCEQDARGALAPATAEALVDVSAGNPLALRELARTLTDDQRSGRAPLSVPMGIDHELHDAFARRIAELPPDARRALCLVAAAANAPAHAVPAALRELGLDEAALTPAMDAGLLVEGDGRRELRHPLLVGAAYEAQPSGERRAVHAALAAAVGDPARHAWHLAHAATGPDEAVAAALTQAADDARARGAHAEAARAGERAARLTPEPAARAQRELQAAIDASLAGQLQLAAELAAGAARDAVEPAAIGMAALVRARVDMRTGDPAGAAAQMEALAEQASTAGDAIGAAGLLLEASLAYMVSGDTTRLLELADMVRDTAQSAGAPELGALATLGRGMTLLALGRRAEGAKLVDAAQPLLDHADPLSEVAELFCMAGATSLWIERFDRAEQIAERLVEQARVAGAAGRLTYPLDMRAQLRWRQGRWAAAYADAEEAVRLARETGQPPMQAVALPQLVRVQAGLGHLDEAAAVGSHGLVLAQQAAGDATVMHALAALGFAELTAGRPQDALAWLSRAAEIVRRRGYDEPGITLMAGDHIEALVRVGRRDDAASELASLEHAARSTGGAWAGAVAARGHVMLAADGGIEEHAAQARTWHDRVDMPFERARTELVIGEQLRRARRRADARGPLQEALAVFERLGAAPWAQRARTELRATGGEGDVGGGPTPAPLAELTPHELQVALLVARGLSNREVGAALFVSPKTIEHHLSTIYRKLDLRSRAQLAGLLAGELQPVAV